MKFVKNDQNLSARVNGVILGDHLKSSLPLIPTEGAPAATADRAYSIWTSLPDGLCGREIV